MEIKKIYSYITMLFISLSFYGCSDDDGNLISTEFYYLTEEAEITEKNTPNNNLNPSAIFITNDKLYICNGNELLVYDALNYSLITSVTKFKKGTTEIALTKLTSINIHGGKIYLGSNDSRLFVLDQENYDGITFLGNGQWWQTFVHVFGVAVSDELLFVKEKDQSIKVFETIAINENTPWNLKPIALLTTNAGGTENYNMKIEDGNLVVAGRNANSYLYYNFNSIKSNASKSLEGAANRIKPRVESLKPSKPIAVSFDDKWAISIEEASGTKYIKMFPKQDFMYMKYNPVISNSNAIGQPNFQDITDISKNGDLIYVTNRTNKRIQILRLKSSKIQEK